MISPNSVPPITLAAGATFAVGVSSVITGADAPTAPVPFVVQCAWCRKVEVVNEFVEASPVHWAEVSHGICPDCFAIQVADLVDAGFEIEARSPELTVTHDPEVVERLKQKEAA